MYKINIKQYIKDQKKFPVIIDTAGLDNIKLYTKPKSVILRTDNDTTDMPDFDERLKLPADVATPDDLHKYINSFTSEFDEDDVEKEKDQKNHSFQSISGTGDGVHFDSKWEYAYFRWARDIMGYSIERNSSDYLYYLDAAGKRRRFYYDFLVNGCPHEVKGIFRANDVLKMEQCPQVKFIYGDEMKQIIKSVFKEFPDWESSFIAD